MSVRRFRTKVVSLALTVALTLISVATAFADGSGNTWPK
jgi:heme/copper-type cytochrome/quinol oxidase subunit 4